MLKGLQMFAELGLLSIVCVQLGPRKLSVIRNSGVSTIQELLKYSSEWKDSWDFQNCVCMYVCMHVCILYPSHCN